MKVRFNGLRISAVYVGERASIRDEHNYDQHNMVRVENVETRKRFSFDFWASKLHPEIRKRSELLSALLCITDDAISGDLSFKDFCKEFGYDNDSIKALKIWNNCKSLRKKALRVIPSLYDLREALQEVGI